MYKQKEDKSYISKLELEENMIALMGGRAAEDIIIGDITTGASNDIERATKIARNMIIFYGMSEKIGPISLSVDNLEEIKIYGSDITAEIGKEVREKVETKVGLLSTYEFMQASTDKNCVSAENPTCSNYNYLTTGKTHTWWLATPLADTTDKAYAIQWKKVKLTPTNSIISVRATIAIKDGTVIAGGSGTEDNPYIVK